MATSPNYLNTGVIIDGYKVLNLIGEGGFSQVYLVSPETIPEQKFALKLVPNPDHFPLLIAEAQILAHLAHPNIPTPIKLGSWNECHYLIMSYIPKTLDKQCQVTTYSFEDTCRLIQKTLQVLQHAHQQGVVHKDLKPGNIGLDSANNVYIFDFNIASSLLNLQANAPQVQHSSVDSNIIQVGQVQKSLIGGTDGYASPEQRRLLVEGQVHPVDARSDIYSLGVMFYQMLVGHLPQGHYRKVSEIKSDLPRWVDQIINTAMDPNPNRRFTDANQMSQAIEDGLQGDLTFSLFNCVYYLILWLGSGIKYTMLSPLYLLKGIGALYSFKFVRWMEKNCSAWAWLAFLFTLVVWAGTLLLPPIYYFDKIQQEFIKEFATKEPSGTIVFSNNHKLGYFSAVDIFKEKIAFQEVQCPAYIEKFSSFKEDQIIWIASEDTSTSNKSHNSIYITYLSTGISKKLLDNQDVPARKGFFKNTPLDIVDVNASGAGILFKTENNQWFTLEIDSKGSAVVQLQNSPSVGSANTNISFDGLLRVEGGSSLKISRNSNQWGGRSLPFGGYYPIWIPSSFCNSRGK